MEKTTKQRSGDFGFGSGSWNPTKFVSEGPLEIETFTTLADMDIAAARMRVRAKDRITCAACKRITLHDLACEHCDARLPDAEVY